MYAVTGLEKMPTSSVMSKSTTARGSAPSSEDTNGSTNGNGEGKEEEKEEQGAGGLYDLRARVRLQTFLDVRACCQAQMLVRWDGVFQC